MCCKGTPLEYKLARVGKEFSEIIIITTPVVVKEKALPILSPGKDAVPL